MWTHRWDSALWSRAMRCGERIRNLSIKAVSEAHEYKLPTALFEECEFISLERRPRLLAASAHWLHESQSQDSRVIRQAREALPK